ncbi:Bile acid 7-alpha dehydratase [Sinobacterium norvegicum]|uniref:Bile acid 7-alpha dehydratase n=1 Tax=Sinobacterium norvegicum TaxID=1641715 RepID=A0ABM9AB51_9GAMM|nr:nuclear transport factor 2 family protein [Sinobacterium norvegicum]CAH0990222.1 Bile acid 7-alpha dehydratase [Sinobacterium norvegicum]
MLDLEAIELIRQLKARYFRFLDTGDLAGMKTVFADDGGIHYRSPSYEYKKQGWDELEAFFVASFSKTKFGMHTGHHPEITVDGDTATGIWYLRDTFVSLDDNITFEGSAIYKDQYIKVDGEWKILQSEYDRLFEQITKRNDDMFITSCPIK